MEHSQRLKPKQQLVSKGSSKATKGVATIQNQRPETVEQHQQLQTIQKHTVQQKQLGALAASSDSQAVQLAAMEEEELQGKFVAQRQAEDEELMQGKFTTQLQDEEELMQGRFDASSSKSAPVQRQAGLPENLKTGVEQLSGTDMSGVNVHYNSPKPAQLNALAYAQGSDIHLGPSQEKHLPHEAWHVAQQRQGRVQPTTEVNGQAVNDSSSLESEADVMGAKANRHP